MPALPQHLALGIAFVLLFFGTVGEISHGWHHSGPRSHADLAHAAYTAPSSLAAGSCPVCEWENTLVSGPAPVVLPLLLLAAMSFCYPTRQPLFSVRQTLALRESRGPPRLA